MKTFEEKLKELGLSVSNVTETIKPKRKKKEEFSEEFKARCKKFKIPLYGNKPKPNGKQVISKVHRGKWQMKDAAYNKNVRALKTERALYKLEKEREL